MVEKTAETIEEVPACVMN